MKLKQTKNNATTDYVNEIIPDVSEENCFCSQQRCKEKWMHCATEHMQEE